MIGHSQKQEQQFTKYTTFHHQNLTQKYKLLQIHSFKNIKSYMGIAHLWQLLLACGKRVPMEFLSGKILAVDASIWIVRADSVFGDLTMVIRSILYKIILLMKSGVRPIFVFDGTPPAIKRNCLELRRRRRVQLGEKEIKKVAQLQLLKMLKGEKEKPKPKPIRLQRVDDSSKEDEDQQQKVYISLVQQAPSELQLIKIQLQSELLFQKYKLFKQIHPHQFFKYSEQEFSNLMHQQKANYIQDLQHYSYQQVSQKKLKNQTVEEAVSRELKRIDRKSKINKLQEQIYRKMVQKLETKVDQGMETVSGNYKGASFKQTRRITKKPQLNKLNDIIQDKRKKHHQKKQQQQQLSSEKKQKAEIMLPKLAPGQTFDSFLKAGFTNTVVSESDQEDDMEFVRKKEALNTGQINISWTTGPLTQTQFTTQEKQDQKQELSNQQIKKNDDQKSVQQIQDQVEPQQYPPFHDVFESEIRVENERANIQLRQLLDLLGVPYIIAPSEAEAQCAYLEKAGLVDGVITDDSDAFAFGAKNVYRGVFENDVKYYGQKQILNQINFSQEQFIIFALLTGSDYTEGVKGVGLVNALQIIKPFNSIDKLSHFRQWAKIPDELNPQNQQFYKTTNSQQKQFFQFHKNFKKYWIIDESFPDENVIEAYVSPNVQKLKQKFKFSQPNLTVVQKLMRQKLKLSPQNAESRINDLKQAIQSMKMSQSKITDYMSLPSEPIGKIRSRRIQKVFKR